MPILGLIDSATFANTVAVTTGSATVTKHADDALAGGDILDLGGVQYYVKAVDGTTVTLGTNYAAATNAALAGAKRRTAPKALSDYILGGGDSAASTVQIVAVSLAEAQLVVNKARGITGPGWWAYRTYTDAAGYTRHKSECIASLKDGSAVSGDYTDDAVAADYSITIDSQPADASVTAPAAAQFVVAATTVAAGGTLSFQWALSTDSGTTFANISNGGVYSGATASTLDISDSTGLDANQYRVTVSVVGGADVVSDAATLTVA